MGLNPLTNRLSTFPSPWHAHTLLWPIRFIPPPELFYRTPPVPGCRD